MKNQVLGLLTLIVVTLSACLTVVAQDDKRINFLGINPSVTVEPFYDKGELDFNVMPIVYQRPFSNRLDFRITSILNLGIRNNGNAISHFGFEVASPIFFKSKDSRIETSKGFYLAPILSITRNRVEKHNNLGVWLEPGYSFLFDNYFALTIGPQFGMTYFSYDNGQTDWGNHFGIKVIFGKWF